MAKPKKYRCDMTPNGQMWLEDLGKNVQFERGHYATDDPAEQKALGKLQKTGLVREVGADSPPVLNDDETATTPSTPPDPDGIDLS